MFHCQFMLTYVCYRFMATFIIFLNIPPDISLNFIFFLSLLALAYACMSAFIPKYLYNFFLKDNSHVIQGNVIFLSHHEEYDYSTGLRCDLQCRLKRATTFYQLVRLVCDVCLCLLVLQLFLKNPLSVYGCYTTVITAINTQKISVA